MKVCEICGEEIWMKDGENRCQQCDQLESAKAEKRALRSQARKVREDIMRSMGLVKVKGALGGIYWE